MTTDSPPADPSSIEYPELYVGDHVTDREHPDRTLVVAARHVRGSSVNDIVVPGTGGSTVADVNPDFPIDDRPVSVVYLNEYDMEMPTALYTFPRERLERVHSPIHATADEEVVDDR